MTITITIDPAVESIGIQTIATALRKTNVTNEEARQHLAAHLRNVTAQLYVEGDRIKREAAAEASAVTAAASKITVS
jgi:hypothetical protein